jgi:hypothetical protein
MVMPYTTEFFIVIASVFQMQKKKQFDDILTFMMHLQIIV